MKTEAAPPTLGNIVTMSNYVDANLMNDVMTDKLVTTILHLLKRTPLEWYFKKQPPVETSIVGSNLIAAQTCVEQIIDLRTILCYLVDSRCDKSYMFGNNKSEVDSSMQVIEKLHIHHTILQFHHVRVPCLVWNVLHSNLSPSTISAWNSMNSC
jgi:hypothetical protein